MQAWNEIKLPYLCERLIAFSVPSDEAIYVLSYEGFHRVSLAARPEIATDKVSAENWTLYSKERKELSCEGVWHPAFGVFGGTPKVSSPLGSIELDTRAEKLMLRTKDNKEQVINFHDLSGDWCFASFSPTGRLVALGSPYELRVFKC